MEERILIWGGGGGFDHVSNAIQSSSNFKYVGKDKLGN